MQALKFGFIFLLILILFDSSSAQVAVRKRSTFSMGGAIQNQTGNVQQSIGQSSVIGSFQSGNNYLAQGFIQPGLGYAKIKQVNENQLQGDIYPNPVSDRLYVDFSEEIKSQIVVEVCNVLGKVILTIQFKAIQKIEIDLTMLSNGIYFIKIKTADKQMTAKLIKE
jgi:hypothetical protein